MANPPFNVDKVKAESAEAADRLPFGMPAINKNKEVSNANYLWISYFYSYLNDHGRAGFVMPSSATDSSRKDKDIREALIKTGHVDVMISVANNFFYTKSLSCTLWFFDKRKSEELQDKVWLYRGETDEYRELISDYYTALESDDDFASIKDALEKKIQDKQKEAKEAVEAAKRKEKKVVQAKFDEEIAALDEKLTIAKEAIWLTEKFGEGIYADIPGLCKVADRKTILEEKGASLTPGAYVGVAPEEDDGVDFTERMKEIHQELLELQKESNELMNTISKNMEEMGL